MATTQAGGAVGSGAVGVERVTAAARLGLGVGTVTTGSAASPAQMGDERRFINRELSTLDYYARVLALAEDPGVPVLERVKFLAIFASLLDEFFEIRVAGLKDQLVAGLSGTDPAGLSPSDQLRVIRFEVEALVERREKAFHGSIVPDLAARGIRLSSWDSLDEADRTYLDGVFEERIFPVLTPLAVDPGHPFPYISNLSLNLAVIVRDPSTGQRRLHRHTRR
jgi:polyphosphate kinase